MVDYELNELRREFLAEAREKVEEMRASLKNLQAAEVVERLAYLSHQLKGSGGSYGYQSLSEDAAEIEKAAESLPATSDVRVAIEEKLRLHVLNMRTEIDKAAAELS